jgi:hypothetical protein
MKTKSRFLSLQATAKAQGCVLERESRGYSLTSNLTGTSTDDPRTLNDVADLLAFDPSFGGVCLGIPSFLSSTSNP